MLGRVDLRMEERTDMLAEAGHDELAALLRHEVVGRNVLDGRWTFQIVEEFDDTYHEPVRAAERRVRHELLDGRRHVFEAELKERRRTHGNRSHEACPPAAREPHVETTQGP